jgi:hypothetical protein
LKLEFGFLSFGVGIEVEVGVGVGVGLGLGVALGFGLQWGAGFWKGVEVAGGLGGVGVGVGVGVGPGGTAIEGEKVWIGASSRRRSFDWWRRGGVRCRWSGRGIREVGRCLRGLTRGAEVGGYLQWGVGVQEGRGVAKGDGRGAKSNGRRAESNR